MGETIRAENVLQPSLVAPAPQKRDLLDPSELGTKEYWDETYARELRNHEEGMDDEGTIWFSESSAEEAVLEQLTSLAEEGLLCKGGSEQSLENVAGNDREDCRPLSRILDLGTGNGHMLFALRDGDEDGVSWRGEMVGVDYSSASIKLAQRIAALKQAESIQFEQWDLLSEPPGSWLKDGFDIVLDKGTFDAISLMLKCDAQRHPCDIYRSKVIPLIKPGRFVFVTSCNWTKHELIDWLAPPGSDLKYYGEAEYPTFTFGGNTGQSIVTVIFRKTYKMN